MEKNIVLCDTNILIELFKNNLSVIEKLKEIGEKNVAISSVTVGELFYGALNKKELNTIKKMVDHLIVFHITEAISKTYIELMHKYSKSHGLAIPDALIAATALVHDIEIFTLNKKDFKYIEHIKLIE